MVGKSGLVRGNKGVASNVSLTLLGDEYMSSALNINMIKRGVLTSRYRGWTRQRAGAFNSAAAFLEMGVFVASDGTRTIVFQVGDKFYSYDLATETQIFTGINASALPTIRMFAPYAAGTPYMVWCNGVDEPKKITSVAASSALQLNGANYGTGATGAPLAVKTYSKPTFVEPFLDRLILAKFAGAGTQYDVLITNAGTGEVCTATAPLLDTDGGVFTMNPRLGEIRGVKAFKISNVTNDQVVLVGQEQGVTLITGTGATTFQSRQLTDEFGIPSNRTWVQVMNDLYFLATDGVRSYSNLVQNVNLPNSALTFAVQDLVNRFNLASLKQAHAFHMRKYQEVVFWFPVDSDSTCKNALVFNYADGNPQEPAIFPKSGTSVGCSLVHKGVAYGGGYDGLLQLHYSGSKYDTTAVPFSMRYALLHPDDPEMFCKLEKCTIITEGGEQKYTANAYAYTQKTTGTTVRRNVPPMNKRIAAAQAAGTVLDSWSLGVGAFPAEHIKFSEFSPDGGGRAWEVELSGTQEDDNIDFVAMKYRLETGGVVE